MSSNDAIVTVGDTAGGISEATPLSPNASLGRRTSLTRRSSVTNLTQYIPANIAANVPFLPASSRSNSNVLKETYFCHICFMNNPKSDGFVLSNCGHIFCRECIKGYFISRINDGQVFLKCFHPPSKEPSMTAAQAAKQEARQAERQAERERESKTDSNNNNNENDNETFTQTCHISIDELDIKAIVDESVWEKYERFKTNIENPNARQCPYCQHTQFGSKDNPIMTCENEECMKQYCFFHSNAHDPTEPCESYDARMLKQNKLNEARINERAKRCPGCNFPIEKISGCNHMRCIKCQTSFCWICEQIIDDAPVPSHYKDPDSPCHGKQFEGSGMGETPPMWIIIVLAVFTIIFGLPTFILSVILGILFCPIAYLFGWCVPQEKLEINPNERASVKDVIGGCWFSWMLLCLFIVVVIPICLFACIYRALLFIPFLDRCLPNIFDMEDEQAAQARRNANNPLGYEADTAEPN